MAKKPEDRFATAGELAKAATAAAGQAPAPAAAPPAPTPPSSTRQFSAVYPNPAATGYTPYPAPLPPTPEPPARKSRFGTTQVALAAATIVLFGIAAVLVALLVSGNPDSSSPPQTPLAVPPSASTATETVTETTSPESSTTSTSPSTSASALAGVPGTDAQGFVGHTARCDPGSTPAAAIRTAQSLAVVCESAQGTYYYRGARLRDGANLQLENAVPAGGGFDVTNPADGARYQVRPDRLTILSNGGVDSAEPALQYAAP